MNVCTFDNLLYVKAEFGVIVMRKKKLKFFFRKQAAGKNALSLFVLMIIVISGLCFPLSEGIMDVKINIPNQGPNTIWLERESLLKAGEGTTIVGNNREIMELRSSNAKFFIAPDGSKIARIWSKPVHWQEDYGTYRDYDTTITRNDDPGFPWSSEENSIRCGFSSVSVPERPTARVEVGSERMSFTPECLKMNGIDAGWNILASASEGRVADDTICYPELYPEIDESYQIYPDKLKNEYIINERPEYLREYSYANDAELVFYTRVEYTSGMVLIAPSSWESDGGTDPSEILFSIGNDERERTIRMPRPYIYDSHTPANGETQPGGNGLYSDYHLIRSFNGKDRELSIGVRVPLSYLLDDATVFPVHIDPTTEVVRSSHGSGKDTFIAGNGMVDTRDWNMGGANDMYVSPESEDYYKIFRALIAFDLTGIDNNEILFFSNATLNLFCYKDADGDAGNALEVTMYRMTHDWLEGKNIFNDNQDGSGATWWSYDGVNNWGQPGADYDHIPIASTWINDYNWFKWDCGDTVRDWLTGTKSNDGFMLQGSSSGRVYKYFYASEHSDATRHPFLELEFYEEPSIEAVNINPSIAVNGSQVSFEATTYDPDSQITSYRWGSDIDDILSDEPSFSITNLSVGTHIINLTVKGPGNFSISQQVGTVKIVDHLPVVRNLEVFDTPADQGEGITVVWDYDDTNDFDHFAVYISTTENMSICSPEAKIYDVGDNTALITTMGGFPLTSGSSFFIGVAVFDIYGFRNQSFPIVGPVSPMDNLAPRLIRDVYAEDTINDQGGSITVSWSPVPLGVNQQSENYFHHYNIYVSDHGFDTVRGLIPEFDDIKESTASAYLLRTMGGKPLDDLVDYYLAVTAVDAADNEIENVSSFGPVRAQDNIAPSHVDNLAARDRPRDEGGVILLEWDSNTEPDLHHYNVYMAHNSFSSVKSLQPLTSVNISANERVIYEVTDVPNNVDLYFAVTAMDQEGNEFLSVYNVIKAFAMDNLAPPSIASFHANDTPFDNGGSITLSWDECAASDFDRYVIYGSYLDPIVDVDDIQPFLVISEARTHTIEINTMEGEGIIDGRDYFFAIRVEDINGNMNYTISYSDPVTSLDNIPPKIINLTYGNKTAFNRVLDNRTGKYTYKGDNHWLNITLDLETAGDIVITRWILDGASIWDGPCLSLNISNITGDHHTIRLEVDDPPYLIERHINFTIEESIIDDEEKPKSSGNTFLFLVGSVLLGVLIVVSGIYFTMIYRPRRKRETSVERGRKEVRLARIPIRKKLFIVGAAPGKRKTRMNVDIKDKLYYLQDDVEKQFSLKKKHYKPKGDRSCPMRNLPRNEFACPQTVVEKCGLACTQKEELNIARPKRIKRPKGTGKARTPAAGKRKKVGYGKNTKKGRAVLPKKARKTRKGADKVKGSGVAKKGTIGSETGDKVNLPLKIDNGGEMEVNDIGK